MTHHRLLACLLLLGIGLTAPRTLAAAAADDRPRLLVLTDIGGDPDDQQSMTRLMTYANEFEIEGLIASSAGTLGEVKTPVVRSDLIRAIVEAYGKVRDNLALHASGFPTELALLDRVKSGSIERGEKAIGDGRDSEGSRWIIATADKPDPRPLNIAIWGGQTDLAQALWRVRKDRGDEGLKQFIVKLRIHDIHDQDKIQAWLFANFPDLFYVLDSARPGEDKRDGAYRGMYLGGDESLTSREWIDTHVRTGHGPLGALYPAKTWTAPNPHGAMKEGDTPSWFYFLPNGLNDAAHPDWGGWGGRFQRDRAGLWRDAKETIDGKTEGRATVYRWRSAFQNEFQARMDWCVMPARKANHKPHAVLNGDASRRALTMAVKPGEFVKLNAERSSDPDNDTLQYHWWVYEEAGTYRGEVKIAGQDQTAAVVEIPADAAGKSLHVILEVRDDGQPPLTAYRRAVIEVK